jgi:8-oxo-dGTP pyrophosphatase MutT (NUDIX family)
MKRRAMDKTLSAGVIVRHPVTRSIIATHPTGSRFFKWKYNQKTSRKGSLDIPKGMVDENEPPIEAAVRELFEETGLAIDPIELRDLGQQEYTKTKDLHLFYVEKEFNVEELKCESYFENSEGVMLPEVNGYCALLPQDFDMLFPSLEATVKRTLLERGLFD